MAAPLATRARFLLKRPGYELRRRRARRHGERFYAQFVGRGQLCFDVGANIGARTKLFLGLGARVVAVEPQSYCLGILQRRFGSNPRCVLVPLALGPEPGQAELHATAPGSVLATLSAEWLDHVRASGRFGAREWSEHELVAVDTLDSLIERFGEPVFCKIDVEGYEHEVLLGLTRPLASLSLEFTPEHFDAMERCVARLTGLGDYAFNYSLGETLELELSEWLSADELLSALGAYVEDAHVFGDVYARLTS